MHASLRKSLIVASVAAGALYSMGVQAQCNVLAALPLDPAPVAEAPAPSLQPQSWQGETAPRLMNVDWHDDDRDGIVGFWNVVITARGNGSGGPPDGTPLDGGIQHWHADRTEFLNSAGQKPQTQNFCMGTWKRTGPRTYAVNHFGINYDLAQHYVGITRIQETVVLSHDGDSFTGTFRADGYDKSRNHLGGVSGVQVGKRITIDTTAQEITIPPSL